MAGHDRFVADLRALLERRRPGGAALCCHPYDLCTELIARELGVSVTDEQGRQLAAPLDVASDVTWIGYANATAEGDGRAAPAARTEAPRPGRMTAFAASGGGIPDDVPDLARFAACRGRAHQRRRAGRRLPITTEAPVFISRAPGRLDVMGGIADYSGALVLQWPIREATRVALRPWRERRIVIVSTGPQGHTRRCDVPLALVADGDRPYDEVRAWFAADPARHWAAYVAGVFHVLAREHAVRFEHGAAVLIESDVPEGKGVSSSAAIEAATMEAVIAAWPLRIEPRLRALRCQQVENLIVGAPCGVMDQMATIHGEAGSLMALLCQPAEFQGSIRLPEGLGVWGIDSGIRHAVSGADYGAVRVGAFMGYRVLAALAGLRVTPGDREGHVRVDDPRWHGYLANVGGNAFRRFAPNIPEELDGDAFLAHYQGTTDLVTRVDPSRRYAIRTPTAHPIHEHERVMEWARQLRSDPDPRRLGALMYESHASYSACGLGSDGTDRLVALAREAGAAARNLWGQDHGRRQRRNGGGACRRRSAGHGPRHRASVRRRDRPRRARVRGELPRGGAHRGDSTRSVSYGCCPTASVMMSCSVQSARATMPARRPSCMTATRSLIWRISSMSLLIIRIDTPSRVRPRSRR